MGSCAPEKNVVVIIMELPSHVKSDKKREQQNFFETE
jgi:hypothetical protein